MTSDSIGTAFPEKTSTSLSKLVHTKEHPLEWLAFCFNMEGQT